MLEITRVPIEMEDSSIRNKSTEKARVSGCWRYIFAVLGFLAMTNSYAMRSHLSVTLVAMVGTVKNTSFINSTNVCGKVLQSVHGRPGLFHWNQELQGIIIGAFYYGYIIPQIIGGRLAEKYSGKWVIFIGGAIGTAATFLGPIAANIGMGFFIFSRILCGLGLSVFQPSLHSLIARWAPISERPVFSAIIYSGNQFGTVIAMPIAGYLAQHYTNDGWQYTFYIFGIIGTVWLILWAIFVYKTPGEHPWISSQERTFIQSQLADSMNTKHTLPVPWKEIFKSKSVWGLTLCHFGYNWGFYTLLTEMPTYMSNILGYSIQNSGFLSSLPYLVMMIVGYASSYAAFQCTKRNLLPVVVVRKGLNTIAFYGSALSLLVISLLTCQKEAIYGMLLLAVVFGGLTYAGFQINHVDLSPNYAGTLEGITNSAAAIPGIIAPYIIGVITEGNETEERWRIVFYITMAVLLTFGTLYWIVGSASLKSWNEPTVSVDKKPFHSVTTLSFRSTN